MPPSPPGRAGRRPCGRAGGRRRLDGGRLHAGRSRRARPASNGQSFVAGSPGPPSTAAGPYAPAVAGPLVGGGRLSLGADRGHVVVLNFWGSWCTPVPRRGARPSPSWPASSPASGVRFLGMDIRDSPASAQAFMSDFRISYPSLNDPSDLIALDFRSTVPPAGIPTTLVMARNGRIAARVIGGVTYTGLKSVIQRVVAQPA